MARRLGDDDEPRLVSRSGRTNQRARGFRARRWSDLYHFLLRISWPKVIGRRGIRAWAHSFHS